MTPGASGIFFAPRLQPHSRRGYGGVAGIPRGVLGGGGGEVAGAYVPPAAGGVGGAQHRDSPTRRAVGNFLRVLLPVSGIAVWTRYFQPVSEEEVEAFLHIASVRGETLRPAGSGLSPNGLALSGEGVLALGAMDRVLRVDKNKMQVTVQAGARVQQVVEALAPQGLALQNYASIREQQIGGITQVGAHGTGPRIPPVDEQVVDMRLSTPGLGTLQLSDEEEPELFRLARVGLGSLGVMTEATLRVVPREPLIERTFTASRAEVHRNHVKWLQQNKHIKYLYIPYTDTVVVVQVNPPRTPEELQAAREEAAKPAHPEAERTHALRRLYATVAAPESAPTASTTISATAPAPDTAAPTDPWWVAAVNAAEAEYWRRSAGVRVGFSDDLLAFDCGGQQWVLEVAFPVAASLDGLKPGARTRDLEFLEALMAEIKKARLPAPSPIEVRWTSGSSSPLSPAAGPPESVHCWVGIIMYLPEEPEAREKVTQAFRGYTRLVESKLMPRFDATWHWAKLETSSRPEGELEGLVRPRLASRFGSALGALSRYRAVLDPQGTLANKWLDAVLGPVPKQQQQAQERQAQE
ncbi:hypothetical protein VOLCADRAFT_88191 [Volvox carteri f. nagariensis]|uniref:FAD-binding PCMH-type domain-containing protein n=1 Tax=Volvox carteri f. nagariensis TaxID=3068 RepID=D8TNI6_VOLCA|nr:uncharacterized protein VOLCADRAFT_88191 [Volvox carteri f. nagariensis]EFJ51000.1 hypothetical protein VOLCADRAFT_88191 [Volvox carteri f. nagariensis]|eukprot:XP_002948012.1 hypothetical protein VOLCADRAFT_88191 [Volvox carteri f. nagariensis]